MTKQILNYQLAPVAGALLAFPACYFVLAAVLNDSLGFSPLWEIIEPIFEKPANKHLGWNINLLILFGPILALIWNTFSILQIKWSNEKDHLHLFFSITKHWLNIGVIMVCLLILATLFAYLFVENCR